MRHLFLLFFLFLCACAATGPAYSPTHIARGQAEIIVYKTQTYGNGVSFTANDRSCRVSAQGFVRLSVPAGEAITLRHRSLGDPSPSTMTLVPKAGSRHYVRVESNDASIAAGAVGSTIGGLVGGTAATAAVTNEGTFVFRSGSQSEANTTRDSGGC